jgi:hypothetical protein
MGGACGAVAVGAVAVAALGLGLGVGVEVVLVRMDRWLLPMLLLLLLLLLLLVGALSGPGERVMGGLVAGSGLVVAAVVALGMPCGLLATRLAELGRA